MSPTLQVAFHDRPTGARGYLVIDRCVHGLAVGGFRIHDGLTLNEVRALAADMSRKAVLTGTPLGGAKSGLRLDPNHPDRADVVVRFLRAIGPYLQGTYVIGADLNTSSDEIDQAIAAAGLPHRGRAVARSTGESPDSFVTRVSSVFAERVGDLSVGEIRTGWGVASVTAAALDRLGRDFAGLRVAIQGFGEVGGGAAEAFRRRGAEVVAVADARGLVRRRDGGPLDVRALLASRESGLVGRSSLDDEHELADRDEVCRTDADVLVLAARGGAIAPSEVESVKARVVVCGANLALDAETAKRLASRSVIVGPSVVASSGALASLGLLLDERAAADGPDLLRRLDETLQAVTNEVLDRAEADSVDPRVAARRLADERLGQLGPDS